MDNFVTIIVNHITYICFGLMWVMCFFTAWSYGKIKRVQNKKEKSNKKNTPSCTPVSIVIPSHNQAQQLYHHLPSILEQDYEFFEVIVVNDGSTDETEDVLKHLELKYSNLRHTFVPGNTRHVSHKRLALTIGVKSALYEWILFTEPSCHPDSELWIESMAQNFTPDTNIVLGSVNIEKASAGKIQFHHTYHQLQYLSWVVNHKAYCCMPGNVAYRKSFFLKHKGFANDIHLVGGAIELLVNRNSTKKNTKIELSQAATITDANHIGNDYRTWRTRRMYHTETLQHLQDTKGYRFVFNIKQYTIHLFHMSCMVALIYSAIQEHWITSAIIFLAFLLLNSIKIILFNRSCKTINAPTFYFSFLWYEMFIIWWQIYSWFKHSQAPRNIFYRKAL